MNIRIPIILIILGSLLLIVGFLFSQLGLPDAFQGIYSGPVLICSGSILIMIIDFNRSNESYLSSRATRFYKFVIPYVGATLLIVYFMFTLFKDEMLDFLIPFGVFIFLLWLILLFIGRSLNYIAHSDQGFLIGTAKKKLLPYESVKSVDRFFFNFFVIKLKDGKKYYFLPHISEVILKPFANPTGLTVIKDKYNL